MSKCLLSISLVKMPGFFSDRILLELASSPSGPAAAGWKCSVPGTKASLQLKLEFRLDDVGGANGGSLSCVQRSGQQWRDFPNENRELLSKMGGFRQQEWFEQEILDSIKGTPGYSPRNMATYEDMTGAIVAKERQSKPCRFFLWCTWMTFSSC